MDQILLLLLLITCGTVAGAESNLPAGTGSSKTEPRRGAADFQPSPQHPAGWRGDGTGHYPEARPPAKWSAKENILWKSEVGQGHSSPILVGPRLFITSEPDILVCLDTETGRELWRKAHKLTNLSAEAAEKIAKHSSQYGDATPTPISDGRWVWVFFGTGMVACHDLEGNTRWLNWYDLRQTTPYGRTASPVLVANRLLVHFGPLVCLEAATGKLLWQNDQTRATYATPAVTRLGDVDVVLAPKGQVVRVADGKILAADLGNCMYPSPVVTGNLAYFMDGALSAVQLPSQAADQVEVKELWSGDLTGDFFASPLVHEGRVYIVDKAAKYYVMDARTGKTMLSKKLELAPATGGGGASIYPSLCLAGKHLLVSNDAGETVILEPGDQGVVVGSGSLPAGSGGTPVFSGRRFWMRGGTFLYCLAAP